MIIGYWRYDPGREPVSRFDNVIPAGWRCQIWTYEGDPDIETWMKENFTGPYDAIYRFNSGDPCYFLHIEKKEDAMLFKLTFGDYMSRSTSYGL